MPGKDAAAPIGLGVDFGTTNSVVALAYADGSVESLAWPSAFGQTDTFRTALMFWREGRAGVRHVAGPAAIARAINPEGDQRFIQSIKTHLASPLFTETRLYGERFTIERLVATFLARLFDHDALRAGTPLAVAAGRPVVFAGERPDEALAVERLATAFAEAGMKSVEFAYEPLGAAYWHARKSAREEIVLVADFGGGTSDFSLLRFSRNAGRLEAQALAHDGVGVAGDSFDYRLIDHVVSPRLGKGTLYKSFDKRLPIPAYFHAAFAQWHQLSWLKSAQTLAELKKLTASAEAPRLLEDLTILIEQDLGFELYRAIGGLKASLSAAPEAHFTFAREGIEIEAEVTRKDFEAWIADDLDRIAQAMDRAVEKAGLNFADVDAVFLTGGTSFVPAVRAMFSERFGESRLHVGDAFQSVASGLALIAADRAGLRAGA
ncbi:Hsp70 family protein [Methylocapsa acidiphila]|uniref:Hsp70 family protein n=1 Tax=Methylocapsa acidiphila TaxID=133552 RepID=UPI0004152D80|nr:Hsp70 family protein [Methylocapsa acidiphila]